jgi:glucose/arabinose dehydrogenase
MRSFAVVAVVGAACAFLAGPVLAQRTPDALATSDGKLTVTPVASGLANPWALAFLPDDRMLVTERPGRLRIVGRGSKLSVPVAGLPKIFVRGQGGLHDVIIDRDYTKNRTIYFCYAAPDGSGGQTALARARLADEGTPRLEEVREIFRQEGPASNSNHFGCRIVQTRDGNLFLTTGDHGSHPAQAQNLGNHIGKVIRVRPDGTLPPDNPFVKRQGAKPEIWSYGHRNIQGATLHPDSGRLWTHEHGPRGGDEINVTEAGKNYGWPAIGYGIDYSGAKIHEATQRAGMEQPVKYWVPSIAPSGMTFYTGSLFPQWKGNLFVGALAAGLLVRLEVSGAKIGKEERLLQNLRERIRDVRQGPDGALYVVTDSGNGRVLRLAPGN